MQAEEPPSRTPSGSEKYCRGRRLSPEESLMDPLWLSQRVLHLELQLQHTQLPAKRKRPCKNKRAAAKALLQQQAAAHQARLQQAEETLEQTHGVLLESAGTALSDDAPFLGALSSEKQGHEPHDEDEAEEGASDIEHLTADAPLSDSSASQVQAADLWNLHRRVSTLEAHAAPSNVLVLARLDKLEDALHSLGELVKEKVALGLDQRLSIVESKLEQDQAASKIYAKLEEIESKIATDAASSDARLAAVETALTEEEGAFAQLKSQLDWLEADITSLQKNLQEIHSEIANSVADLDTKQQLQALARGRHANLANNVTATQVREAAILMRSFDDWSQMHLAAQIDHLLDECST